MKLVIEIKGENETKTITEPIARIEVEVENLIKLLNYAEILSKKEISILEPKIE